MPDEHFVSFCLVSEAWPTSSKDSRRLLAFFAKNFAPDSADLGFRWIQDTNPRIHTWGVLKRGIPPTLLHHIVSILKVKTRIYWDRRYQCSDQPIPAYIRDKPWAMVGEDMIQSACGSRSWMSPPSGCNQVRLSIQIHGACGQWLLGVSNLDCS